jgi:hypothetical protein
LCSWEDERGVKRGKRKKKAGDTREPSIEKGIRDQGSFS